MTHANEGTAAGTPTKTPPSATGPAAGSGLRVMQNTVVVFIARIVGLFFAGAATFLLGRALGPERYGEFAAIYAYLGLFIWLASFGVGPLITREAAKNRQQAASILFTGVCISACFALVTAALAYGLAPLVHLNGKFLPLIALASVELFLLVPAALYAVIYQVDLRQWYSSGFSIVRQVLWFTIVLALYFAGAPLIYVVLGRLAAAAVETGLNWYFARQFLAPPTKFLTPVAGLLLRGGLVVTLTTVAVSIYMRIDQVMLHSMVGDLALGPYAAAVRISELFEALPAAFGASLFPLLCVSFADPPRFRRHLDLGYRYMVLAGAFLSVAFSVGARPLMHFTYGDKFAGAAPLLALLIWAEIPIFFGGMLGNALMAAGLQSIGLWATVAGAILNVGLNIYLIPRYGALGATWATVVSYWLCWTIAFLPFRASRGILWAGLRLIVPITAVAVAVTAAVSYLPANDWVRLILAVFVFAGLAWLFKFARKEDMDLLRQAWITRLGMRSA